MISAEMIARHAKRIWEQEIRYGRAPKPLPEPRPKRVAKVKAVKVKRARKRGPKRYPAKHVIGSEYMAADPCAYCGGTADSFDHIEPVYRGGADDAANLARACRRCNFSKNTIPLLMWLARSAAKRAPA